MFKFQTRKIRNLQTATEETLLARRNELRTLLEDYECFKSTFVSSSKERQARIERDYFARQVQIYIAHKDEYPTEYQTNLEQFTRWDKEVKGYEDFAKKRAYALKHVYPEFDAIRAELLNRQMKKITPEMRLATQRKNQQMAVAAYAGLIAGEETWQNPVKKPDHMYTKKAQNEYEVAHRAAERIHKSVIRDAAEFVRQNKL